MHFYDDGCCACARGGHAARTMLFAAQLEEGEIDRTRDNNFYRCVRAEEDETQRTKRARNR